MTDKVSGSAAATQRFGIDTGIVARQRQNTDWTGRIGVDRLALAVSGFAVVVALLGYVENRRESEAAIQALINARSPFVFVNGLHLQPQPPKADGSIDVVLAPEWKNGGVTGTKTLHWVTICGVADAAADPFSAIKWRDEVFPRQFLAAGASAPGGSCLVSRENIEQINKGFKTLTLSGAAWYTSRAQPSVVRLVQYSFAVTHLSESGELGFNINKDHNCEDEDCSDYRNYLEAERDPQGPKS